MSDITLMAETPKQSSNSIDGPPKDQNQISDFSFKVKPLRKLELAMFALCDSDFNPKGLGRIDVDHKGFEITVPNTKSGFTANLWLNATGLINFECRKPVEGKVVRLTEIYDNLREAEDEDSVTIYLLDGSTDLKFMFGKEASKEFSVELFETGLEIGRFPKMTFFCEACVPTEYLWEIIEEEIMSVGVKMSESMVKLVALKEDIQWQYTYDNKIAATRGLEPGHVPIALFNWSRGDCQLLQKACLLDCGVLVCFLTDPPKHIMLRFNLRELGDLVYVMEVTEFFPHGATWDQIDLAMEKLKCKM